jgi:hypothetical protein
VSAASGPAEAEKAWGTLSAAAGDNTVSLSLLGTLLLGPLLLSGAGEGLLGLATCSSTHLSDNGPANCSLEAVAIRVLLVTWAITLRAATSFAVGARAASMLLLLLLLLLLKASMTDEGAGALKPALTLTYL